LVYGYMLNQLLPAKMGEAGRAEYLARNSKLGRSFLLGSIVAERIFDMMVIVLFLAVSVGFSETVKRNIKSNYLFVLLLFVGFIAAFILLYNINIVKNFTHYLPQKAEAFINRIVNNVAKSFSMFNSFKKVALIFIITLIIWSITCLMFFFIINDLGITVPFYAYFFIVSAGTFGMIIPSTSANVGVYHAVAMGALMIFMVQRGQALSFAIIAHAFDFFPSIIMGGIIFGFTRIKEIKTN